jgi:hypothetical protein
LHGHIIFDAQIVMNAILALVAVGALVGLVLGRYFSWIAILVSVPILAIFSAMVLQNEGFDVLTGIAIIVVCLTVNQVAYWTGLMWLLAARQTDKASLPDDQPHDEPGEAGHDDIGRQNEQQEQAPSRGVPMSEQRR